MFQIINQLHFTFQEYRDKQKRALSYEIERFSDGRSDERRYKGEQKLQGNNGGRVEVEEFVHSGKFAKIAKIENWNTDMEPNGNRDDDERPTTATPTAPDGRGVKEDVDRLHMYVTTFIPYFALVANQEQYVCVIGR